MIGKRQKELLERCAQILQNESGTTGYITIEPYARFTREAGGGSGYPVLLHVQYDEDNVKAWQAYMSTCSFYDSALNKADEIKAYLATLGAHNVEVNIL